MGDKKQDAWKYVTELSGKKKSEKVGFPSTCL